MIIELMDHHVKLIVLIFSEILRIFNYNKNR